MFLVVLLVTTKKHRGLKSAQPHQPKVRFTPKLKHVRMLFSLTGLKNIFELPVIFEMKSLLNGALLTTVTTIAGSRNIIKRVFALLPQQMLR